MKNKFCAFMLCILLVSAPFLSFAENIDLSVYTLDELYTLRDAVTAEIGTREGAAAPTPTPVPASSSTPAPLTYTTAERATVMRVEYISDREFAYYEKGGYYDIRFAFKDKDKNYIKEPVPVVVHAKIKDGLGNLVYDKVVNVTASQYSTWTWGGLNPGKLYMGNVYIQPEELSGSRTANGTVSITIENDYWSFDEYTFETDELPDVGCTILLPNLPRTVTENDVSTKVISITYEAERDIDGKYDVKIYFTGEKTYDRRGNNQGSACRISWKLKDAEGYIVDSGTVYSDSVTVGEKFRDEIERIYDLDPGEYTLILYDSTN